MLPPDRSVLSLWLECLSNGSRVEAKRHVFIHHTCQFLIGTLQFLVGFRKRSALWSHHLIDSKVLADIDHPRAQSGRGSRFGSGQHKETPLHMPFAIRPGST